MSSQEDIPPSCPKILTRMIWIAASIFVLGFFMKNPQGTGGPRHPGKEYEEVSRVLYRMDQDEKECALYLRGGRKTDPIKKPVLEQGILKNIESLWRPEGYLPIEELQVVSDLNRDFDHMITYMQDQDGKKRGYFLYIS